MKISTEQHYPNQWTAIDADTYDGAEDAGPASAIGAGNTEQAAIDHLIEQFENGKPWQQEAAREYRAANGPLGAVAPMLTPMPHSALAAALDRGLATGRLIEEAERLIRTIETSHKKAVRELPIAPLLAAVARMKEMG